MEATSFELTLSLPHDARFAETVRGVVVHAAQYVGCGQARAEAFGQQVEAVVRRHLDDRSTSSAVPVVVRRAAGPLEIVVDGTTMTLDV